MDRSQGVRVVLGWKPRRTSCSEIEDKSRELVSRITRYHACMGITRGSKLHSCLSSSWDLSVSQKDLSQIFTVFKIIRYIPRTVALSLH